MTKTMRTLFALVAVAILGTIVYAQEKPKTVDKKALPNGESDSGNLVRSLNMLQGNITLQPGTNVSITKAGNALTIAAANALTGVAHDSTLTGNGTAASPLSIAPVSTAPESPANRFQNFVSINLNAGILSSGATLFTAPSTHQLAIEYVSAHCVLPSGQKFFELSIQQGLFGKHALMPAFLGTRGGLDAFQASESIKMHVNPGETLEAFFSRTELVASASCFVTASGRLIPVP